jgi:galactokinase
MPRAEELTAGLNREPLTATFKRLYGADDESVRMQRDRFGRLLSRFTALFGDHDDVRLFSAPGRTEVGGNHTDHNHGHVLAAAVNLDVIAAAGRTDGTKIVVESDGYPRCEIDIADLAVREEELNTTMALIRGVCARISEMGRRIGGFQATVTSMVPDGSGLSSSAAFEVLIATILNYLYNDGAVDALECALIGQYAERKYFGKPCGLMDQTTSAVGGFVTIDFGDPGNPAVRKVAFDFPASGLSLVIVKTGASHADLTHEYAACHTDMVSVAHALGGEVLRDFSKDDFLGRLPQLHGNLSDRALLRALHFFDDDLRVLDQVAALERADVTEFLELIIDSGRSSWMLLQNCYRSATVDEQPVSVALALSADILRGQGAWRVHGGGFAGTIQAFVPHAMVDGYIGRMDAVFGAGSCHELSIRPDGAIAII